MHPAISVVIATRDRRDEVSACLEMVRASASSARKPAEVIVVDDGSRDGTAEMLFRTARKWGKRLPLRPLRLSRSRGPAGARNAGAAAARAPWIVFTDSDCLPERGWLKAFIKAAKHGPELELLEGAVIPAGRGRPGVYSHIVADLKGGQGLTANLMVRSKAFRRLGGLDERYNNPHCREDTDFYFTAIERGLPFRFVPSARVRHPIKDGAPGVFLREARYGIHEPMLFFRHPRSYLTRLKWIDGLAFPVYHLGFYAAAGAAVMIQAGLLPANARTYGAAIALAAASLAATLYARLRGGRRWSLGDLVLMALELPAAALLRLFWVALGLLRALGILLTGGLFRGGKPGS